MKLRLIEIETLYNSLSEIAKQKPATQSGMFICFKIAKIMKSIQPDYDAIIQAKQKIDEQYKDRLVVDADGNPVVSETGMVSIKPEYIPTRLGEIMELMNNSTEINISPSIKYSELAANFILTAEDFMMILPVIIDDSDESTEKNENPEHNTKTE